ncbi:pesticidal protein Cry7Aa [Chryseobacterium nematophagum]|uniref:Pesticidal protein Cry7Aa n=1 Tax=Chryseobacterium nematophagum TaxID=2305228 RepID=A0A3M7TIW5_9FLAO|nr:pesticidal protein Cry7Aa [Chryseobacterium nematophagum]RNA62956.1 pesticidal protein Cry7Aa [Chryseobacterium nematophagum]
MINVKKEGIILEKTNLGFESSGVLNPAVLYEKDFVHLFYRAVSKDNYSSIGYCQLKTPLTIENRMEIPFLYPQYNYEKKGVEDPRIVKIDGLYYLTYTAYDGINALGALATSEDLVIWEKRGLIVPQYSYEEFKHLAESRGELNEKYFRFNGKYIVPKKKGKKILIWDKNVILFPRRIHGKLYFLHRIKPDIQIVSVYDLSEFTHNFWDNFLLMFSDHILISSKYDHEVSYVGGGCPPIETEKGWLLIYHGVHDTVDGYVYCACATLLDLENPTREIARLPYPLFKPEYNYELHGKVNNVCFPSGTLVREDTLYIYYGAADEHIACASVCLSELLKELTTYKNIPHE